MSNSPSLLPAPLTGILLAGGKSSRMGREKGLVEFRGKPLISYGIDLLSTYTDQILISSANPDYLQFGFDMVPDEMTGRGPAAGLAASLNRTRTDWNLVLACDLPFMEPELIDQLLSVRGTYHAVIPIHQDTIEPLCGLYHKDLAMQFSTAVAEGKLALHKILPFCKVHYLETDQLLLKYPNLFANFNSLKEMEDYC